MTRFGLKIKDKRELLAYINKLKNKQAKNALERFEVLEERDKIAKLGNKQTKNFFFSISLFFIISLIN